MGKLEPFEGKTTSWCGLWWHPEYCGFSSEAISLADIKKFKGKVRLYVRKNKFYNKGENGRPNYCFCLKDANAEVFHLLEVKNDKDLQETERDERLFTYDEVQEIVNRVACYVGGDGCYGMYMVSDFA